MKLINFSQNIFTVNSSKCPTFSKFASFHKEPIWCDIVISDKIIYFQNQIVNDKK